MAKKNDFGAIFSESGSKKVVFYQKSGEKMFEMDAVLTIILSIVLLIFLFWLAILFLILVLVDVFYFEVVSKDVEVAEITEVVEEPKEEKEEK